MVALQPLAIWSNLCNSESVAVPAVSGGIVAVVGGSDRPGCCCCGDGAACVEGGASICDDGGGSDDIPGATDGDSPGLGGSVTFALGSIVICDEKSMLLRSTIEPLLAKKGTLE
jgi:hypothetical protein